MTKAKPCPEFPADEIGAIYVPHYGFVEQPQYEVRTGTLWCCVVDRIDNRRVSDWVTRTAAERIAAALNGGHAMPEDLGVVKP